MVRPSKPLKRWSKNQTNILYMIIVEYSKVLEMLIRICKRSNHAHDSFIKFHRAGNIRDASPPPGRL